MARVCVKPVCDWMITSKVPLSPNRKPSRRPKFYACSQHSTIRSSQNTEDTDKFYKELGMFSLRKKIKDTVLRAESLTPAALELEEARRIEQEETVRHFDLWDDLTKSSDILMKLASRSNVVDALKDLRYKAEEAKLITQLAEMDAINYGLFKQAYSASVDVSKFLDTYEMSKLLRGPFDAEGACMIIRAGTSAYYPEMWVKQLLRMYTKWSHKQGLQARAAEMCFSEKGGIRSVILELESKYMYGHLSGERGVHSMISNSANSSVSSEAIAASVDVIPLFLEATPDLQIDDNDLLISLPSSSDTEAGSAVCVQHIPTGLRVESSGERSRFANKIKAVNRLKAKLLVILRDQRVSSLRSIEKGSMTDIWHQQYIRNMVLSWLEEVGDGLRRLRVLEKEYGDSIQKRNKYKRNHADGICICLGNINKAEETMMKKSRELKLKCREKRNLKKRFEHGFLRKMQHYVYDECKVIVYTPCEMEVIVDLKNRYGFKGSVVISKNTYHKHSEEIKLLAGNNNINWDEEPFGISQVIDNGNWRQSKIIDLL